MRKAVRIVLATVLILSAAACSSKPETKTVNGKGKGFGGSEISVTVTLEGDKITDLKIDAPNETPSIGGEAVEPLRQSILNAGTIEGVDGIAGATMTSNGIFSAIKNAIDPEANPYKDENIGEQNISASGVTYGLGVYSSGRKGPGTDDTGTQVWSFNEVYANVMFDKDGRILAIYLDQMEVATPNYDGESMPHLSGFPGQGGYNEDSNHDEKVDGKTADTEEQFMSEIASWTTKRERGDGYQLSSNTWSKEADIYQELFVGMTVDEVEEWYSKYCSDVNGRPLKITEKSKEEDVNKFNALSKEEQDMLVDLTSGATMSLNDGHGNIIAAIRKAYDNRSAMPALEATQAGFGVASSGRKGPGTDDTGTQVWSFNEVYAYTLFDSQGRIVAIYLDQTEVATPNYDGESMPHLSGFPGQGGYNEDSNHDEKVDGKTADTEEQFMNEVASWTTKRERGDGYQLSSNTWSKEADIYQNLFIGMTVDEVEEWYSKYCSDVNGRPLKITEKSKEEDVNKFNALSKEEQDMLVDLTSGATMSLNDGHGNIVEAIRKSYENRYDIKVSVK